MKKTLAALAKVFKIETDEVFEIGLTPNRADAMSHWGVARDLRAGLIQRDGKQYELITPSVNKFKVDKRTFKIDVKVNNPKLTPRYCGITISGITVKSSPEWLKNKLKAIGLTPKNNIVDVTNYVLHELGRLREITFREVGEGTNESTDIDKFDKYYHHMFLWDEDAKKVAGAYRMGLGSEIYPKYGMDGFYLNELFRFEPELHDMMSKSIEMGRAFIVREYQQKPMPLFLLWKGIIHTTLRFPEHKFLLGGVSISNQFSEFSKSLMIEFMKSNFYDPYIAQYIHPKKAFKVKLKDADKDFVFNEAESDLNKFDKIIDELEPGTLRLPVLIKKYIKQNARVVAFNVDPLFNDAVDGLMYIRISDIPDSTVKPVMEEFQAELERKLSEKGDL